MARFGVIFSAYQTKEYVEQALAPWVELRRRFQESDEHRILICAVSVRFAGFEGEDDGTRFLLRHALENDEIDHLIDGPDNVPEVTARGMALNWLQDRKVGISIQWDADEVAEPHELDRMLDYVLSEPYICWFRIPYRNLVFDTRTWLAEPFTPPRIHRLSYQMSEATHFSDDNDIAYGARHQSEFASLTIPSTIINPLHFSWLNDERSKRKQAYQWRRWGHCSFIWDEQKGLVFNSALPIPKVAQDLT